MWTNHHGSHCMETLTLNNGVLEKETVFKAVGAFINWHDVQVLARLSRSWRISWLGKDEMEMTSLICIAAPSCAMPSTFATYMYIPKTKKNDCLWWRNLVQMRKWLSKNKTKLSLKIVLVWKDEGHSSWKEINLYYYIKWLKSLRGAAQ